MLSLKSPSKSQGPRRSRGPAPVVEVLELFAADCPEPRCELYYRTPFQLLLSVALSAQTTDKAVNQAMQASYDQGLTPADVVALGEQGMLQLIRRIGLAPTKAKRAVALAAQLLAEHAGEVPNDRASLEALPGVGRKTASVVLGEIFKAPTLAVDTHVYRVAGRLGWHQATTADACADTLARLVPKRYLPAAHHWLVLHGRYVCKARSPACQACILRDLCPSAILTPVEEQPKLRSKKTLVTALKQSRSKVALPAAKD